MERKKTYEAPKVEHIVLLNKQSLLSGSGEGEIQGMSEKILWEETE